MPDITMCQNSECSKCGLCYRFVAEPNRYHQSYDTFKPDENGNCAEYVRAFKVDDE